MLETPQSTEADQAVETVVAKFPGRRWLMRSVLIVATLLCAGVAATGWWFQSRYVLAPEMKVPIQELTKFEYPEDPGMRSIYCGRYDGRELLLVQKDDVHFDFVLQPQHDHVAKVTFKNVDVSRMTPGAPAWTKDDPGLVRIALTDREWNRQQVHFDVPSEYVEVEDGNQFERDNLIVASLAKNCLNAGLWEVILKANGEDGPEAYYHGWFTFPLGQYKRLIEHNTGFSYWDHWYKLEHWSDPAGTVINLDGLRTVGRERELAVEFDRDESILVSGEQVRKKRTTNATNLVTWDDMIDRHDVTFATFRPPGYYDVEAPWSNEYWRLAKLEKAILREIKTPNGEDMHEVEVVFLDEEGAKNRFFVGGIDLRDLPQLSIAEYPRGLYMPMGIGVPPFYQDYEDLLANDPQESPYYSVLLDGEDRWIDHHTVAIDGPIMHRDPSDPNLVHLYLLSYERHSLVAHIKITLPPVIIASRQR